MYRPIVSYIMANFKWINISRRDGWKYSATSNSGEDYKARIFVNDDGSVDGASYSNQYKKEMKKSKKEARKSGEKKEGCLMKIIKAPFRLLWWIFKTFLVIITCGLLKSYLEDEKK